MMLASVLDHISRPQTTTRSFRNPWWRKIWIGDTSWLQPFACEKAIYAFGNSNGGHLFNQFVLNSPLILEIAENCKLKDKPNKILFLGPVILLCFWFNALVLPFKDNIWFYRLWTPFLPIGWFTFWAISSEPSDLKILNRCHYQNFLKHV